MAFHFHGITSSENRDIVQASNVIGIKSLLTSGPFLLFFLSWCKVEGRNVYCLFVLSSYCKRSTAFIRPKSASNITSYLDVRNTNNRVSGNRCLGVLLQFFLPTLTLWEKPVMNQIYFDFKQRLWHSFDACLPFLW